MAYALVDSGGVAVSAGADLHCTIIGDVMRDDKEAARGEIKLVEGVALHLMDTIAKHDARRDNEGTDRRYWLALYSQCLLVVTGHSLQSVLPES